MTHLPSWPDMRLHRLFLAVFLVVLALTASSLGHTETRKDREFRECPDCPVMVGIPAGTFLMGSPKNEPGRFDSEGPQHVVSIKAFALGKYEITTAQFIDFLKSTGHRPMPCNRILGEAWGSPGRGLELQLPTWPAVCLGWIDAEAYVAWLNAKVHKERPALAPGPGRIVSRAKRSGSMPLARGPKRPGGGVRRSDTIAQIATAAAAHGTIDCSPPSKASPPTRSVSTAC